jgi:hypothetical protein
MSSKEPDRLEATKRLMGALGRMPPKPHEEMKIGKSKSKSMTPKGVPAQSKKRRKTGKNA